jgi:hypothetical protein
MSGGSNDPTDKNRLHHAAREALSEAMDELGLAGSTAAAEAARAPGAPRLDAGSAQGAQVRTITLVDLGDGVLAWRDGVRPTGAAGLGQEPRLAAYDEPVPTGEVVQRVPIEIVGPNQVVGRLIDWDRNLTPNQGLRRWTPDGGLVPCPAVPVEADGTFGVDAASRPKRALLFVHGTFSNSENIFQQLTKIEETTGFLAWSKAQYEHILAFDHPTMSVSPVLNGMDLARLFAGVKAPVDVICHSRGGLVARWWLEAFGGMNVGPRRVVFVASPLGGTSIASPPRLRNALDMFTTVGAHLRSIGQAASVFLPFMNVAVGLLTVFNAVTGAVAKTPLADAAFAMVPGLGSMSRVNNNSEFDRLHADRPTLPQYFAITSDFSMEKVGWKFWKVFDNPVKRAEEALAGQVFSNPNDLVVDTPSMIYIARGLGLNPSRIGAFGESSQVHHTNYFLQPKTAEYLTTFFNVPG